MQSSNEINDLLFQNKFMKLINHFVENIEKETKNQLVLLKKNIDSLKTNANWKFPSDHVVEDYEEQVYDLFYNRVCHAASIALISWFKEMSAISQNEGYSLRTNDENTIENAKNKMLQPFSIGRFLIQASEFSGKHEFVIINLQSKIFLIQADIYRQLKVKDEGGILEITLEDLQNLFSNDQSTFKKLFGLADARKAHLQIDALDWYQIIRSEPSEYSISQKKLSSLIFNAIKQNDLKQIMIILEHPNFDGKIVDAKGNTPLTYAIELGADLAIIKLILRNHTIDPNEFNDEGMSPLTLAISQKNQDVIQHLIVNPLVELEQKNASGQSALDIALLTGEETIISALEQAIAQQKAVIYQLSMLPQEAHAPILSSAAQNNLESLILKIDSIDPNQYFEGGEKPY